MDENRSNQENGMTERQRMQEERFAMRKERLEERRKRIEEKLSGSNNADNKSSGTEVPVAEPSTDACVKAEQSPAPVAPLTAQRSVKTSKQSNKKNNKFSRRVALSALVISLMTLLLLLAVSVALVLDLIPDFPRKVTFITIGESSQSPFIGTNGNWWIGDEDTGIKASSSGGQSENTPLVGSNGNWWIDDRDTGIKATLTSSSAMLETAQRSVVVVYATTPEGDSTGTGVIVTSDGYILTNYHVVEGANAISIKLYGDKIYTSATIVGFKEHDDVAVLKIDKRGLAAATFGNSDACRVGEQVFAIGCPKGTDFAWSVTRGIVSAPERELKLYDSTGTMIKKMRAIQTDAPVNHGNSGGPLVNSSGQVIGIITFKLTDSSGMGFALPSNAVLKMVTAIIENGSGEGVESTVAINRPLVGITCVQVTKGKYYRHVSNGIEEVTQEYAESRPASTFRADASGVLVTATSASADVHGKLKAGDIIVGMNGQRFTSRDFFMNMINDLHGGDTVTIIYVRDGIEYAIDVVLGKQALD